jgi:hypothetical protein
MVGCDYCFALWSVHVLVAIMVVSHLALSPGRVVELLVLSLVVIPHVVPSLAAACITLALHVALVFPIVSVVNDAC